MFGSSPSKLDGEMLLLRFEFWPKLQYVLWNLCIFMESLQSLLFSFPVENQLTLVNLIFFYVSPLKSLNLVLIPGADLDGHRGTWTGCSNSYFVRSMSLEGFGYIYWIICVIRQAAFTYFTMKTVVLSLL